jgi:hypothetical protein
MSSHPSPALSLDEAIHSTSSEVLKSAVMDPGLGEDLALALLKRADVPAEILEQLSKQGPVMKIRKVKLALVSHPRTPRHVSVPIVRHLFTFDLMKVALGPAVPADIKMAADETVIRRLETITIGERQTLARRASGRVAGALLLDPEARVMRVALENARLTESAVMKPLMRQDVPAALVDAVSRHSKWSVRREIRIALLRNEKTPMARALEFARSLPASELRHILQGSRLPANIKKLLLKELDKR